MTNFRTLLYVTFLCVYIYCTLPLCQTSEFLQCFFMHALQQSDLKQSVLVTEVAQLTELKTVDRLLNIVIRNSLKLNRTTNVT